MTKQEAQEYARSREVLARYGFTEADLDRLHRAETSLHRIAEIICSVEMSDAETKRIEKREAAIEKRITALAKERGVEVRFNGDPRGGAVRLILPNGERNGWDGESWGIYW